MISNLLDRVRAAFYYGFDLLVTLLFCALSPLFCRNSSKADQAIEKFQSIWPEGLKNVDVSSAAAFYEFSAEEAEALEEGLHTADSARRKGMRRSSYEFASPMKTGLEENDLVKGLIYETLSQESDRWIVITHGYQEGGGCVFYLRFLARLLCKMGFNCILYTQPFHGSRRPDGTFHGDMIFSGGPDYAVLSIRQAVLDIRKLVFWINRDGQKKVILVGFSLGSLISINAGWHEKLVNKVVAVLPAVTFTQKTLNSRIVGYINRNIQKAFSSEAPHSEIVSNLIFPENFKSKPQVSEKNICLIYGKYDPIAEASAVEAFAKRLNLSRTIRLGCGHASLILKVGQFYKGLLRLLEEAGPK